MRGQSPETLTIPVTCKTQSALPAVFAASLYPDVASRLYCMLILCNSACGCSGTCGRREMLRCAMIAAGDTCIGIQASSLPAMCLRGSERRARALL